LGRNRRVTLLSLRRSRGAYYPGNKLRTMKKRLIPTILLIVYSVILVKVMVFKDVPVIRIGPLMLNFGGTQEGPANLFPFKTILPYLLGEKGLIIAGLNIGGNIILLVPIGFLVPFVYRNMTWKKSLALAVGAGLAIEGMQVALRVGIFDIDDVILNGLGVMIGYWAFAILARMESSMKRKTITIASIIVVAAAAAFYGFIATHKRQAPASFRTGATDSQPDRLDTGKAEIPQGEDPCGGTGGTGQIVSLGNNSITIKRNDGVNEIINLTVKTTIKNSVGSLSQSDLKIGDRVTVVVMSNHIATTVLVCNAQIRGPAK